MRTWQRLVCPEGSAGASPVLARLDNGDPFLVERDDDGGGRVAVCAVPADDAWSNLPLRTCYLPLIQGLTVHLASSINPPRNLAVGQHLLAFAAAEAVGRWAVVTDPAGEAHRVQIAARAGGGGLVDFIGTAQPGLYRLETSAGEMIHYAVAAPAAESDLNLLSDAELDALAKELGATVVDSWQAWRDRDQQRRHGRELWPPLVWLVLALLFGELWLQARFARTGT